MGTKLAIAVLISALVVVSVPVGIAWIVLVAFERRYKAVTDRRGEDDEDGVGS